MCVVRAGGTWQTYCDLADLSSNDPCIDQQRCWEAGSAKNTNIGGDTDSVCVYASANELHLSNYILFVLQAINYPSMFLLFTALDNSFLRTYAVRSRTPLLGHETRCWAGCFSLLRFSSRVLVLVP